MWTSSGWVTAACAATATRTATQSFANGAAGVITMTGITQTGGFSISGGGLRIPRDGYYMLSAKVMFQSSTDGYWRDGYITKNGAVIAGSGWATNYLDIQKFLEAAITPILVSCKAGDVITLYTSNGNAMGVREGDWTSLTAQIV